MFKIYSNYKSFFLIFVFFIAIILNSCSKRIHPSGTPSITPISGISSSEVKKDESKTVVARKPKATFPKVISVNDSAASKSVDGRLYYDVLGHRYWRNYKDGKYYLYNKSMYNDPAFKKPD